MGYFTHCDFSMTDFLHSSLRDLLILTEIVSFLWKLRLYAGRSEAVKGASYSVPYQDTHMIFTAMDLEKG
jgi:hypothetical protein